MYDAIHSQVHTLLNLCQCKVCNVEKTFFHHKEHMVHSCRKIDFLRK